MSEADALQPPAAIRVAILTVSDSAAAGRRTDESGPSLSARCRELGWQLVDAAVVPDEPNVIAERLRLWIADGFASLILTTGGTGISSRDNTPEATRRVLEKELPGVAELLRQRGLEQTPFSVLSRAVAGTCAQTFVVNLPGSPHGAVYSLSLIEHLIPHVLRLLEGHTEHTPSGIIETQTGNKASHQ